MAKVNLYQLKADKIRAEMQNGRGSGVVSPYPVEMEPSFESFTHKGQAPKSGFWGLFTTEKTTAAPAVKQAKPVANLGFISINLPTEGKLNLPQFEKFILSLKLSYPLSFEVIGTVDKITLQLACQQKDIALISGIFQTHFPDSEAIESSDNLSENLQTRQLVVATYCLKESHFFPLNTNLKLDPYSVLLSNLSSISRGVAALQLFFTPVKNNWADNMRLACRDEYDLSKSFFADLPDLPKLVIEKTGKPLFAVSLRLIASNQQLLNQAESFLSQYANQHNGFARVTDSYPASSVLNRTSHTPGMILNSEELVGLIHLPDPELNIPKLAKAKKSVAAPKQAQTTDSISLGHNIHQGKSNPVFISQEWLTRHVAIFGGTGTGKTNLLGHLFQRLIRAHGGAFIDPNGDAAQEFLSLIPQNRIDDVIYFDPLKTPLSINPLDITDKQQIELVQCIF